MAKVPRQKEAGCLVALMLLPVLVALLGRLA